MEFLPATDPLLKSGGTSGPPWPPFPTPYPTGIKAHIYAHVMPGQSFLATALQPFSRMSVHFVKMSCP